MRKKIVLLFSLFFSASLWAGDRIISVKGGTIPEVENTEVSINSDSIVVKPATDITVITVAVTDVNGEVLSEQVLPAQSDATVHVNTPSSSDGYTLELRDDNGLIYSESEF